MKKLQIAALLCFAFVLMPGCHKKASQGGATPAQTGAPIEEGVNKPQQKEVEIDAACNTSEPEVKISRSRGDHVRWTASVGSHFRVTFAESPCHGSAAPGSPSVSSYDVPGGGQSKQCFPLPNTETKKYKYSIERVTGGNATMCADPAVIVEN